jgi:HD-GYP domain-containing protein (c-di-GMP phosphodiesterase class II)
MSLHNPAAPDELLLRDLVGGLSVPGRESSLSVGILGSPTQPPQPPAHCLGACLNGDPGAIGPRGCAFLTAAAGNHVDPASLRDGRCLKGFRVAGQPVNVGGQPLTLVTVDGFAGPGVGGGEVDLLGHLDSVSRLVQRIGHLLEENAGFAEEVLRNYEQLNLIFDLTQQIAQVAEARAIERLLLQRVAGLLKVPAVCVATASGECRTYAGQGDRPPLPFDPEDISHWVAQSSSFALLSLVRTARQVHVESVGGRQVILGPLVRLDEQVDVVLAARPPQSEPFTSGDMMMVESVLAFGGQIISNSELHERLRRMSIEVTRALVAAIDKKDHYTSGHSERAGFLTRLTAQELGLPPAEQQIMEWAGLLHDVGKIGIPEGILCKPGKLTEAEFEIVKQHPRMGYEILKPIASLGLILDAVLYHHEYPDGSGYPEGLPGDQIPLVARIIHVVDTFDALTSTRSYRKAFTIEKAFEIIQAEKNIRIDAEVAEAFSRAFEAYRRDDPEDFAINFGVRRELEYAVS